LRAEVSTLVTRIVHGRGFNYWESGMDIIKSDNLYDSFIEYQTRMIEQFDCLAKEYRFITINADRSIAEIFAELRHYIKPLLR